MPVQMAFKDIGVDTRHWHIVQGFGTDTTDMLVDNHRTLGSARTMLRTYVEQVSFDEGIEPTRQTRDRVEFDTSEIAMYELAWLGIVKCEDLACLKAMEAA